MTKIRPLVPRGWETTRAVDHNSYCKRFVLLTTKPKSRALDMRSNKHNKQKITLPKLKLEP